MMRGERTRGYTKRKNKRLTVEPPDNYSAAVQRTIRNEQIDQDVGAKITISDGFKRDAIRVKLNYLERGPDNQRDPGAVDRPTFSTVSIAIRLDKSGVKGTAKRDHRKCYRGGGVGEVGGRMGECR